MTIEFYLSLLTFIKLFSFNLLDLANFNVMVNNFVRISIAKILSQIVLYSCLIDMNISLLSDIDTFAREEINKAKENHLYDCQIDILERLSSQTRWSPCGLVTKTLFI